MNIDFKAFFGALVIVTTLGATAGVVINMISPAQAFCGAMKKDPQPNYADEYCRPV